MKIQNHFRLTLIFERDGMQPRRQPVVVDDVDLCEPLCDGPVQLEVLCRDPDAPRVVLLLQRPRHHRRPRPGGGGGNLDGEVTGGPGRYLANITRIANVAVTILGTMDGGTVGPSSL